MNEVFKWVKGINKGNIDQVLDSQSLVVRIGHMEMDISQKNLDSGQSQVDIGSLTEW